MYPKNCSNRMITYRVFGIILLLITFGADIAGAQQRSLLPPAKDPEPQKEEASSARIESMEMNDMEITNVLKILSDTADWNIIPSKEVRGKIFVFLKNIDSESALKKIVEANGYRMVRTGNTVLIMTEKEYETHYGEVKERTFPLSYARAVDVAATLTPAISEKGKITVDAESNQVIVFDLPNRLERIQSILKDLDKKTDTRVIPLQFARAADVLAAIGTLLGNPKNAQIDERTNRLIITDTPYRIERIESVAKQLDLEDMTETRAFKLKFANADDVADMLNTMLYGGDTSAGQQGYGSGSGSGRRNRNNRNNNNNQTSIAAVNPNQTGRTGYQRQENRSNLSNSYTLDNSGRISTSRNSDSGQGQRGSAGTYSGAPQQTGSADAGSNMDSSAGLNQGGDTSGGEARALGSQGTITADARTNSVIVTHTPGALKRIESIIKALDVETQLYIYQFREADMDSLELDQRLPDLLSGTLDDFQVDSNTRKVSFRAPADRAQHVLALLKEWDKPTRQVYIEGRILRVSLDTLRDLGATIQAKKKDGDFMAINSLFPAAITDRMQGNVQLGSLTADNYQFVIEALETDSRTKLLSNPKVTVMDHKEAQFQVVVDHPFNEVVTEGNSDVTRDSTRFISIGVTLQVAPQITNNGTIMMDVNLEVSSMIGRSKSDVPIVDRSAAQSSVSIGDGHTLAIGGLIVDEKMQSINRIPVLGSIPVIKHLFRTKSNDNSQSELVLFLTPKIVGTGDKVTTFKELELKPSILDIKER